MLAEASETWRETDSRHPAVVDSPWKFKDEELATLGAKNLVFCYRKGRRTAGFLEEIDGGKSFPSKTEHFRCWRTALEQPSRIPKSSMPYHSDTVTGRGLAEEDDFEVVRGAAIDADTYLGYHHRSPGDRRRMLKSTNGGTITAA